MNAYIYQADIWCEACGKSIREKLIAEGKVPEDPDDETTYDSDEFPKGPYDNGGGEADLPQHCAAGEGCLDPLVIEGYKYGAFLENELTFHGMAQLGEQADDECRGLLVDFWLEFYKDYDLGLVTCPHCKKQHTKG